MTERSRVDLPTSRLLKARRALSDTPVVEKRVLVAEDDKNLAKSLERAIVGLGYSCQTVFDGEAALREIGKTKPDAVVLDLLLPKKDGRAVLQVLQDASYTRSIPVIVISGVFRGRDHARELEQAGARVFLEKPFSSKDLGGYLRQYLGSTASDTTSQSEDKIGLAEVSVAELIWRARTSEFTGGIHFKTERRHKILFFEEGRPTAVRSNLARESLGQRLLASGWINKSMLEDALRRAKRTGKRHGEILVDLGAVRANELEEMLRSAGRDKILELFGWNEGESWQQPGLTQLPLMSPLDGWSAERAVLHGAERMEARRLVEMLEPSRDHAITRTTTTVDEDLLTALAKDLLQQLTPSSTVGEFIDDAAPALFALKLIGALEFGSSGSSNALEAEPTPSTNPAASVQGPVDALRQLRVKQASMTHFEVLGVGADATLKEIRTAYVKLVKMYHPDRFSGQADDVVTLASEVFARITEANDLLCDSERRRVYLSELRTGKTVEESQQEVARALTAESQFQQGEEALRKRDYDGAFDCFEAAIKLDSEQGDFHVLYGWALWLAANQDDAVKGQALENIQKGIGLAPSSPTGYYYLGRFRKACEELDDAEKMFRKVLELQPGHVEAGQEVRLIERRRNK